MSLIQRLWDDYLRKYWWRLLLAMLSMGILAFAMGLIPVIVEQVQFILANHEAENNPNRLILWGPIVFALIGTVYAAAQYSQSHLSLSVSLDALHDIQTDMYSAYLAAPFSVQREEKAGDLASRFTNDMTVLREMLARATNGIRDVLQLLALVGVMIFYDPLLLTSVILIYAALGWPITTVGKALRRSARKGPGRNGHTCWRNC